MDEGLKRKLVGAGVLVAVAIVVLPQLSTTAGDASYLAKSVPIESNIPDMSMPLPKSLAIPMSQPSEVAMNTPEAVTQTDIKVDQQTLKLKAFQKPVLENTGQSVVWHIQVGSFSKASNAFELRDNLRKAGYAAFEAVSKDGAYTRVFVGPSTQKQQLEEQMLAIKQAFKIQGQLVVFEDQ
ncbi:SPOR domain-containing protein [Bermanella sp. WJH001]|uniref:SPOR domain-containing protein n=1 Tax=Bermanella sp. WJH001 TaxID=3048005 RepID=UPI0024BDAB22|nr:SPOR domain-containing protein [Bermanella sp. WJH001]MDJ1536913.1 SPOR domain-containing protein [Bermanella sp. WJH001]